MSERTDPERSPATESPRARSRPLTWLGGPEDAQGVVPAASSPRPPVVPARKTAAALGAGGVASLPRSPRPVPYFSGALARADAAAAAAAAALADEASPVVPSSLLGGGGAAGACDAAPLVLSDREDTSGTEASEGYAQVHGSSGDSVASPRLSGASATLLVSLQSPPGGRPAAVHAGGGGSTTILGVELAPGFKTPTAALGASVDVTDLGDLSALKGVPPSGGDSGGGGSVAPLSARSTSSGGSPRVPPGPPPRDRKPVRPPVTPEMSQMSPDHGAVRAAAAALRLQSTSSSMSTSRVADPAGAVSAPLSFRAEPPVPPPVSFDSAAPTAISTPVAQGSVAGAQVFSPSLASPIVWMPSTTAAAAFAPSGDASSPAALARQQQQQQAALPPPPPPPSEADRDRRIDFTTFCTTIAMLQVRRRR